MSDSAESTIATPNESGVTDTTRAFEAAVRNYHRRVRETIADFERRLEELNTRYREAVRAAADADTFDARHEVLLVANEEYWASVRANIDTADGEVEDSLREFVDDMKAAWDGLAADDLTTGILAWIGQQTWIVASAAAGAFPAVWWRP